MRFKGLLYRALNPDTEEVWRIGLVPARNMASIASDLYLKLTTPQRNYWFTFPVSQGYSSISIFPITNPYADGGPRDLLGPPFGANPDSVTDPDILNALRLLSRGEDAPTYIMLPEIGRALWYDAAAVTDDETADRDPMPRGMFRRTQCLVAPL